MKIDTTTFRAGKSFGGGMRRGGEKKNICTIIVCSNTQQIVIDPNTAFHERMFLLVAFLVNYDY